VLESVGAIEEESRPGRVPEEPESESPSGSHDLRGDAEERVHEAAELHPPDLPRLAVAPKHEPSQVFRFHARLAIAR